MGAVSFILALYTKQGFKSMFKTDGSVHNSGIKNELDTIAFLNEAGIFKDEVKHLGGTKNKADAMAGNVPISIKHKKGLKNGSFDWVNTSKVDSLVNVGRFSDFLLLVDLYRNTPEAAAQVEPMRSAFANHCEKELDGISSEDLTAWLHQVLVRDNAGMVMAINDTESKELHMVEDSGIMSVRLLKSGYRAELVKGRGKSSRKVIFKSSDSEIDTGLRLRLTSNNGIKAFLGMSKANKNSQIVLKLQQDNIKGLINTAHGVNTMSY